MASSIAIAADESAFPPVPAEAYPSIARPAPYLADLDGDARFEFGLKVVLDGLEQRRAARASGGTRTMSEP
jgi:hypothetical protein